MGITIEGPSGSITTQVEIGFAAGGYATFLWGQLPYDVQAGIARVVGDAGLPVGFYISGLPYPFARFPYATIEDFAYPRKEIIDSAESQLHRKIREEVEQCSKLYTRTFNDYLKNPAHKLDLQFVMKRGSTWKVWEGAGHLSLATESAILLSKGAYGSAPGLVFGAGTLLGVFPDISEVLAPWESYLSPEEREILDGAFEAARLAGKECFKGIAQKYGISKKEL